MKARSSRGFPDGDTCLSSDSKPQRSVRSFVRREGRLTRAQQRALSEYWEDFGLDPPAGNIDWTKVFGRTAPLSCEIGFGDGQALLEMASAAPKRNFIGLEVYRPGVGALLLKLKDADLQNVRVSMTDAVVFLEDHVAPASLDTVLIFFPDPWPKKRHHKRRLIQPPFIELVADRLVPGGTLHCATDWEDYAVQMMEVLSASQSLVNACGEGRYAPRPAYRPQTKYERRGEGLGHQTWDLVFQKV